MPVNFDKTRRFALNLPVEIADKVALLAEADRRSVASWLRNCVVDAVEQASIESDAKPDAAPDEVVTSPDPLPLVQPMPPGPTQDARIIAAVLEALKVNEQS